MFGDNQFNTEKITFNFAPFVLLTIIALGNYSAFCNESTLSDYAEPIPPEFRGLFRSEAEQIEFERKVSLAKAEIAKIETKKYVGSGGATMTQWYRMGKITNSCGVENIMTELTTLDNVCRGETLYKERMVTVVHADESHHGCCVSKTKHLYLKKAYDVDGNLVTLAEYGDRLQFFESETCERTQCNDCPLRNCPDCDCQLQWTVQSAVIYNSTGHKVLRDILIPGSCKCRNK